MSSIDYPPLVDYCNLGETPRIPTPESIGLRDTVHERQSRMPGLKLRRTRKSFKPPIVRWHDLDFGIGSEASRRITAVIVVVQFNLEHDELLLLAGTDPLGRRLLTTAVAATR